MQNERPGGIALASLASLEFITEIIAQHVY